MIEFRTIDLFGLAWIALNTLLLIIAESELANLRRLVKGRHS